MAIACKKGYEERTGKILVVEKILLFIKHHFSLLWRIIEWGNGQFFSLIYRSSLEQILPVVFHDCANPPFIFRRLEARDIEQLHEMINAQGPFDLEYFHPHGVDIRSLKQQLDKPSFLMMGVFAENNLIGYFFLRFFINKKCFVGRLTDKDYRGRGIGPVMNNIMYETAWRMGFHCLSTISKYNRAVMVAHSKNKHLVIRKQLANDFLLVEFIKEANPVTGNIAQNRTPYI